VEHDPSGGRAEQARALARALALASALFAGLVLAFFFVPQWILVEIPWGARSTRVWIATLWVGAAFVGAAAAAWRASAEHGDREP